MATAPAWISAIGAAAAAGSSIYSGREQRQAADKARREQRAQIAKATAEAQAERQRIENIEKERLERLRKKGSGLPPSLITGMSGVQGEPNLLGA